MSQGTFPHNVERELERTAEGKNSQGSVPGDAHVARAARRARRRVLRSSMFSDDLEGPFVDPSLGIWDEAPACRAVRPPPHMHPSPVRTGRRRTYQELRSAHLGEIPLRAVVWTPRGGLGNAVRGVACALVYALLSGREMLTSSGGPSGLTFDTVALGFEYPLDRTGKGVPPVSGVRFGKSVDVWNPAPVVQMSVDGLWKDYWWGNETLKACVMQAFQCESLWCIMARATRLLLGRPLPALGQAVIDVVRIVPPRDRPLPDISWGGRKGKRRAPEHLDFAQLKTLVESESKREGQIKTNQEDTGDEEAMVKTSEGRVMEEESSADTREEALRLRFDVALHIRAVHRCVEGVVSRVPACQDRGPRWIRDTLTQFPELRRSLEVAKWSCITQLLAFLLHLKLKRQQEQGAQFKGLFYDAKDSAALRTYIKDESRTSAPVPNSTVRHRFMPRDLEASLAEWGLWTVGNSETLATQARVRFSQEHPEAADGGVPSLEGLNILLATDTASLRQLFIELLRPFGTVAFAKVHVVHLTHNEGSVRTRLGNLAEFYLLSRGAVILGVRDFQLSTFARTAAYYSNATVFTGLGRSCSINYEHLAQPVAK